MNRFTCVFTNELGNRITTTVITDEDSILVSSTGPTSSTDHTWTRLEAQVLQSLLTDALNSNKGLTITSTTRMD